MNHEKIHKRTVCRYDSGRNRRARKFLGGVDETNPSDSSEEWDLIADVTLEEDVYGLVILEDLDGNAFDLKKMLILITYVCNEELELVGNTSAHFSKEFIKEKNGNVYSYPIIKVGSPPKAAGEVKHVYSIVELVNNRVFLTESRMSYNTTSVTNSLRNSVGYSEIEYRIDNVCSSIDSFAMRNYLQCIHKGTSVKLYGIRK